MQRCHLFVAVHFNQHCLCRRKRRAAAGGAASADTAYRPKVATWGIFPRPANISRQYGGGRTFKPGEARLTHLLSTDALSLWCREWC